MTTNFEPTSAHRHASNGSPRSEEEKPDSLAIEAESIGFTDTDGTTAVTDVSLRIHGGEVFGFLGANGAGKTSDQQREIQHDDNY